MDSTPTLCPGCGAYLQSRSPVRFSSLVPFIYAVLQIDFYDLLLYYLRNHYFDLLGSRASSSSSSVADRGGDDVLSIGDLSIA